MVEKGRKKEGRVANILSSRGYNILERNKVIKLNQYKKAEIDIIAKRGNIKYAIEVKSGKKQKLSSADIKKLIKKANKIKAKPMLATGPNIGLTDKARELIRKKK